MPITPLPTPPSRQDPANFNSRTDAFLLALQTLAVELNSALPGESAYGLAQALAAYGAGQGGALVGFRQTGSSTDRTVDAKLREGVSIADFGGIPNDNTKAAINRAALEAAVASFEEQSTASLDPSYSNAGGVYFPPGSWRIGGGHFDVERAVHFYGDTFPTGNSFGSARLIFDDGDHGLIVHSYMSSSSGKGADGTIIENLAIIPAAYAATGSTPAAGGKHGVWIRTKCHVDVQASGWSGDGVHIEATAPGAWSAASTYVNGETAIYLGAFYHSIQPGNINHVPTDVAWWAPGAGTDAGNANNWSSSRMVVQQNGWHGAYAAGADVNASYCGSIDSRANRRCGVRDNSFLGIHWAAAHSSSNGSAGLVSHGGNHYYCLSDTLGASTTPGTNPAVWGDMGAGSTFPAWSGAGTYYIGLPYYCENANARSAFDCTYSEGGQGASVVKLPSQIWGGLHGAGNSAGFGFDPTLSTAPFWDADLAGAVLRYAHLTPTKGLNFVASKMVRSADADTLDAYTEAISHTPTSSGITTTGTITYSWQATRVGNRVDFVLTVGVSGGTNAFTAGTSYVSLPAALSPSIGGACVCTTTSADQVGIGHISTTGGGRVYLPTWAASNKTVIISGVFIVSSTAA